MAGAGRGGSAASSVFPTPGDTTVPKFRMVNGSAGGAEPRLLTSDEVNQRWKEAIADIDRIMQYYKNALVKLGVPDAAWLHNTLARHRASLLQQTGYELDVASGHESDSVNQPDSYRAPDDMKQFFAELAEEFSVFCMKGTNPNYGKSQEWKDNCQRCVPTYEARRRGAQVTAKPYSMDSKHLVCHPFDAWINPNVIIGDGSGKETIEDYMSRWGNGARAQIVVLWNSQHNNGHTFIAEQKNGKTIYYDPQSNEHDVSRFFDRARPDTTRFCRIDNLKMSGFQSDCFEEETHG